LSERYATIDVGTNTVLLLVAERDTGAATGWRAVFERIEITRLGKGVDRTRRLDAAAMERTLAALARYAAEARAAGARGLAVSATSAARDAENGAEFLERARRECGVEVEIIAGDEEARLSWDAVARDFADGGAPLAVFDIGGGSTEFIYGDARGFSFRRSLDIGSVRLTERHGEDLAALRAAADGELAQLPDPPPGARAVGVAGTVTTLAAVRLALADYDGARVHGLQMTREEITATLERLAALPLDPRRRVPGLMPERADVIVAGGVICERAALRLGVTRITVSDRGVRWGLLYKRFGG
jgi:exopolyphosphatase/guanosine-5'-triphosphate,3'-diphosphate pyrophosphatase